MKIGQIANEKERYYPCKCNDCGWLGSSEDCGTDSGYYGDSDVYCPRCGSTDTDEYEHNHYPIYHLVTDLISRFKAWRINANYDKYWNQPVEEAKPISKELKT